MMDASDKRFLGLDPDRPRLSPENDPAAAFLLSEILEERGEAFALFRQLGAQLTMSRGGLYPDPRSFVVALHMQEDPSIINLPALMLRDDEDDDVGYGEYWEDDEDLIRSLREFSMSQEALGIRILHMQRSDCGVLWGWNDAQHIIGQFANLEKLHVNDLPISRNEVLKLLARLQGDYLPRLKVLDLRGKGFKNPTEIKAIAARNRPGLSVLI